MSGCSIIMDRFAVYVHRMFDFLVEQVMIVASVMPPRRGSGD